MSASWILVSIALMALAADEDESRLKTIWEQRQKWLQTYSEVRSGDRSDVWQKVDATRKAIKREENSLSRLEDDLAEVPNVRKRAELKKAIKQSQAELTRLKKTLADEEKIAGEKAAQEGANERRPREADFTLWPELDVSDLKVGAVGKFPFPAGNFTPIEKLTILEIAAKKEPTATDLNRLRKFGNDKAIFNRHNVEIIQVISETEALVTAYDVGTHGSLHAPTVWLQGIGTDELSDGSTARIDRVMEVTGTKKYTTTTGASRTILVVEPFDVEQMLQFLPK